MVNIFIVPGYVINQQNVILSVKILSANTIIAILHIVQIIFVRVKIPKGKFYDSPHYYVSLIKKSWEFLTQKSMWLKTKNLGIIEIVKNNQYLPICGINIEYSLS